MTCAHRDDAGAYVLGALTPDEHERFAAHLGGCEACRAEVGSLQVVADTLPLAAEQVGPPPELKERIMAVVRAEADVLRAAGPEADVADAAAPARPPTPEPAEERARARRTGSGRKASRPWWRVPLRPLPLAAAASALVALIVAGAVLLSGGGDQERTVQARVVAPSAPGAHAALVVA
ncbi:MAG: hypothetical protein QOJ21_188, partial [Solirubrobacteraceae bacterium]|nr:hypothetical protein [Solirubrobacteraceae bacterium]